MIHPENQQKYDEIMKQRAKEYKKRKEIEHKENQQREFIVEQQRKQFKHDWAISIFGALAGALLSKPLWDGIAFLQNLFTK